jgi:hypothetical protein
MESFDVVTVAQGVDGNDTYQRLTFAYANYIALLRLETQLAIITSSSATPTTNRK